ncbi:MAG: type II toxin-antitoxin system HicA family toxin [Ignavibacteriales bacterium]|nr:MAG: type II toxin-antitoxin system HicA family toxin [Ignavibacteriales bacterium]
MKAAEAEKILLENGFIFIRTRGSHKIYMKNEARVVIPFHKGKILHPKIVKQVLKAIE